MAHQLAYRVYCGDHRRSNRAAFVKQDRPFTRVNPKQLQPLPSLGGALRRSLTPLMVLR